MIDRRRTELRTDSATLGAVLIVMGWYAMPWQPMDTLFTQVLASQGLEQAWGFLMIWAGAAKVAVSMVRNPPARMEPYWDRLSVLANLLVVFVAWWTFFQFAEVSLYTPTVLALAVIGAGSLATLIRDANNKKGLRCRYGGLHHPG